MDEPVTIAFDFDGVLHDYAEWVEDPGPPGPPVAGALDMILELRAKGYQCVVFSCRTNRGERFKLGIVAWLREHGFPPLSVVHGKPKASLYVDDRGFRFSGPDSWTALRSFLKFQPTPGRWGKPEVPAS